MANRGFRRYDVQGWNRFREDQRKNRKPAKRKQEDKTTWRKR